MFRRISQILVLSLLAVNLLAVPSLANNSVTGQTAGDRAVNTLANESAKDVANNVLFNNIASLAGASCSLYGLGVDLVNVAYDGQWSFVDSMLELSVLFRNQSWREIIWSVEDEREAFVQKLVALKKQRCLLGFAAPEASFDNQEAQRQQQIQSVENQIVELEEKIDYYSLQRRNMLFDKPSFPDMTSFDPSQATLPPSLPVDKIFYALGGFTSLEVNWDQFLQKSKSLLLDVREDASVVFTTVPEDCSALVRIGQEMDFYFATKFRFQNGVYRDAEGNQYASFKAFVETNGPQLVQQYIQQYCSAVADRVAADNEQTGAEEQFALLQGNLNLIIQMANDALAGYESQLAVLQRLQAEDEEDMDLDQLQQLKVWRGRLIAIRDYHSLVLRKVGASTSKSLDALAESLESFTSAVLGVIKDDKDQKQSRISFAERFANANERNLQQICSRIEAMYREAGRSTADLPVIGYAKGREYCRARPQCADVGLDNLFGSTEGRKKLAECSGFLFDQSELGPSQLTKDVIAADSEDIGVLLEQRALNDLLKQRNLHFASLRNRYKSLYGAQSDTTVLLEQMISDTTLDLFNPNVAQIYDPNRNSEKTHSSLLQKIYQDFYAFMDEQEGSCPAPEKPEV